MGTNYYRIPSSEEMIERKELLVKRVQNLNVEDVANINCNFQTIGKMDMSMWERKNLWDEFTEDISVHLGKRSSGWKFLWNFHNNKYYTNKEELLSFIKSGRVINEYGEEFTPNEFIEMALGWGHPDGWDTQMYYESNPRENSSWFDWRKYADRYVDGLRISSSTDFS